MFYKKFISIDIGNRNIKLVELSVWKKNITIHKTVTIPAPEDAYYDGKMNDLLKMKLAIADVIKVNKFTASQLVYPSICSSIITRVMTIPVGTSNKLLGRGEICSLIRNEIQQYLSIDMDNYIVSFAGLEVQNNILETTYGEGEKKKEKFKIKLSKGRKREATSMRGKVRAVVYPKEVAEGYYALAGQLKKTPIALDINSNSCCKIISYSGNINGQKLEEDNSYAFIDIGYEFCNIFVIKNYMIEFHRVLNNGLKMVDKDISTFNSVNMNEAEAIREGSYLMDYDRSMDEDMGNPNRILTAYANEWANTVSRIIQYYNNENKYSNIKDVYLLGGGSNIKGIDQVLKGVSGLKVEKINKLANINGGQEGIERYISAIGAAIRR